MTVTHVFCALAILEGCAQAAYSQTSAPPQWAEAEQSADSLDEIDEVVKGFIDSEDLVGAVTLVYHRGQIVHWRAYGLADRESKRPMEKNAILRIHSFTKAISTAAALMLFESGKFQLDDPVEKYLPNFADAQVYGEPNYTAAKRPMTVRDLMRHTSGLVYPNEDESPPANLFTREEIFNTDGNLQTMADRLAEIPLKFSPGDDWCYGVSIDVLGRLIEVWSGQTYESFVRQQLLEPLGMVDTAFHVPPEKLARLATLYEREKEEGSDQWGPLQPRRGLERDRYYVPHSTPSFCMPGGGLFSTAHDYLQFLRMILCRGELEGRRYLKPETVALMTSDQLPSHIPNIHFDDVRDGLKCGLGFAVFIKPSQWDPTAKVGEFGWGGAASCHYWVYPPEELIVITLESTMPYNWNLERGLKPLIYSAAAAD